MEKSNYLYFCFMKKKKSKNSVGIVSPFASKYEFIYMDRDRGNIKVDVSASCRVYIDSVFNEDRNSLPLRSKEMFLWMIGRLRSGDELIVIHPEKYMKEFDIASIKTVRTAIKGLINASIIAKTDVRNIYFINAYHFFRGSRIRKWPEQSRPYVYARETNNNRDATDSENLPF